MAPPATEIGMDASSATLGRTRYTLVIGIAAASAGVAAMFVAAMLTAPFSLS